MKKLIGLGRAVACAMAVVFGLTASAAVPPGYTECPYIQFTMGAYIDTLLQIDGHRIQFKFEDFSYYNDRHFIGSDDTWMWIDFTSYNNAWYWGCRNYEGFKDGSYSTGVHVVDFNNDAKIYLDGELLADDENIDASSNGRTLLIGRRTNVANFAGRFFYLIVSDQEGNEVAHLVPVRKEATGEVGFYDTVRNDFYGNEGGGSLWAPGVIVVKPEQQTASQYVQDGLVAQWDGIENAGAGLHDDKTNVWTDLTGNGWNLVTDRPQVWYEGSYF